MIRSVSSPHYNARHFLQPRSECRKGGEIEGLPWLKLHYFSREGEAGLPPYRSCAEKPTTSAKKSLHRRAPSYNAKARTHKADGGEHGGHMPIVAVTAKNPLRSTINNESRKNAYPVPGTTCTCSTFSFRLPQKQKKKVYTETHGYVLDTHARLIHGSDYNDCGLVLTRDHKGRVSRDSRVAFKNVETETKRKKEEEKNLHHFAPIRPNRQ